MKKLVLSSGWIVGFFFCISQLNAQQSQLLVNRPIKGANHLGVLVDTAKGEKADFFVHDMWMKTYNASQQITYSSQIKKGVADQLNVKDGAWVLDSVQFYMSTKQLKYNDANYNEIRIGYQEPQLDSLQIQIWKGEPFAKNSIIVWGGDSLTQKCAFHTVSTEIRYAERYLYEKNRILWKFEDTCKLFTITAVLPQIRLPHGEYYIAYLLKSSYENDTNTRFGAIRSLAYNSEIPYSGEAFTLDYQGKDATRMKQENQEGLSLAMNVWGKVEEPWTNDLTISSMSFVSSCDMSKAVVNLKIKNLSSQAVNTSANFKVYYSIDKPEYVWGNTYIDGDTIESKLDFGSISSIPAGGEIELAYLAPKGSEANFINLGSIGAQHRVRAWIVWDKDNWIYNNQSNLIVRNPGEDIASEQNAGDVRYAFSFPSPALPGTMPYLGMTTAYPAAYAPATGGWSLDDTSTVLLSGNYRTLQSILWKPASTNADDANNQWLFSDCLDLEAGVPYRIEMVYVSFDKNFDMEVKLGSGVNPESMTQVLSEKITLRTDSVFASYPTKVILDFTPINSGVQNIGFHQITPIVAGGKRTPLAIWSMSVTKMTPHRLDVRSINLPVSACGLTATDSVRLNFSNAGYQVYNDSIRTCIGYIKEGGKRIEKKATSLIKMKARMSSDELTTYTFPSSFDLSEEGVYTFDVTIEYKEGDRYVKLPIPAYAIFDSGKVVSYYPLNTPVMASFTNKSTLGNWKDITANTQTGGEWSILEDSIGRDKGCLEGIGIGSATNAWFTSSCITLSADSVYEISLWVKYGGQGVNKNNPTFSIGVNTLGTPGSFKTADLKVAKEKVFAYTTWREIKTEFMVSENKSYYVGLNYMTKNPEFSSIRVDDFCLKAIKAKTKYKVDLSVNNAAMGTVSGEGIYDSASTVVVKAMANAPYEFANWTENDIVVSKDTVYSFLISQARNLKANFKEASLQRLLTVKTNDSTLGTVRGGGSFKDSALVTIVAIPTPKIASFVAWKNGDKVVSTDSVYTFALVSDLTLFAEFKKEVNIEQDQFASVKMYVKEGSIYMEGLQSNTKLQVIDVMGRIIESVTVSGTYNFKTPQQGIYMVRLFDANNIKTYKLSVR